MNVARSGFDAVELGDGSVLVVGDDVACIPGEAEPGSERAEIYEPAQDRWVEIASLNKPRKLPATVPLVDGSAMVIGGVNDNDVAFSSTKILSPSTRDWSTGPLLNVARADVLAAPAGNGRILVANVDYAGRPRVTTTEVYDPATDGWTKAARLDGVTLRALVPLTDGRVLGVGSTFEISLLLWIYDPDRNLWISIETPGRDRVQAQFVGLEDGAILAVGGSIEATDDSVPTAQAERYDPQRKEWIDVAPLSTMREAAALVRIADGRVLVIGGIASEGSAAKDPALRSVEVFDPTTNVFTATGDLLEPRYDAQALALRDGSVLVMGGANEFNTGGDSPWCPAPMTSVERLIAP